MANEKYLHGHSKSVVAAHSARTAAEAAAFVLPELCSPMRLLDFGCGPGSITIDLAEHLLPEGSVVGIDSSESVIEQARNSAIERGVSNVDFEVRSIYDTKLPSESFDGVYAHQVLQHLADPVSALREARRMMKPDGLCAVREVDWGTSAIHPFNDDLRDFLRVYSEVARRNGGEPDAGRFLKGWFLDARFADTQTTTSTWTFSDEAGLKWWGEQWADRIKTSSIATSAIEYGIADESDLERISQAWLRWMNEPGAFFVFTQTEVIGRR
ncbi:MAG: methyltransferase domain-containing protein [Dehalococcoidia bacterium]